MKSLIFSILAFGVLVLAGCGATPTQRWASARETLTATQDGVLELHAGGVISDKELVQIDVVSKTVRRALGVAETRLPDGGPEFEDWISVAQEGLARLVQLEKERIAWTP